MAQGERGGQVGVGGGGGGLLADFVGRWTSDRETCIIHLPKNPNQFFALATVWSHNDTACVRMCVCVYVAGVVQ